jgi:hypothetical protein
MDVRSGRHGKIATVKGTGNRHEARVLEAIIGTIYVLGLLGYARFDFGRFVVIFVSIPMFIAMVALPLAAVAWVVLRIAIRVQFLRRPELAAKNAASRPGAQAVAPLPVQKTPSTAVKPRASSIMAPSAAATTSRHLTSETIRAMGYHAYLATPEWKRTRARALTRAAYRCQLCGNSDRLEVHHNHYGNLGNEADNDLIVLCRDCHGVFHEHRQLSRH